VGESAGALEDACGQKKKSYVRARPAVERPMSGGPRGVESRKREEKQVRCGCTASADENGVSQNVPARKA